MESKLLSRRSPLPRHGEPRRIQSQRLKDVRHGRSMRRARQPLSMSHPLLRRSSMVELRGFMSLRVIGAVKEAIAWIIAAMFLRLSVDGIMTLSSQFWLLGGMVACFPAVIAIWMTYLSPQRGVILGYRCLLVMVGLLLGGKLGVFCLH